MLQVCLNGSRRPHERVPVTLTQIADAATAAVAAGAESVHVHPRTDLGRETLDADLVSLTVESVRHGRSGRPVGVTTREGLVRDGVERLAVVSRWPRPEDGGPDFASVNWHEGLAIDLAHRPADPSHRRGGGPVDPERRGRLRRAPLAVAGAPRPHRGRPRSHPRRLRLVGCGTHPLGAGFPAGARAGPR